MTVQSQVTQAPAAGAPAANQAPAVPADQADRAAEYVATGEQSFRGGKYQDALRDWQHAMIDDPNNGGVVLLMSQALFAVGQWDASANTLQAAMQMLPETEWGTVVKNYTELYPDVAVYTKQIRAAEDARDAAPDDPALRFLLGYHFGYLNYPKQAVEELDKALDVEPRDAGAEKLRGIFAKQGGLPARPATPPAGIKTRPAALKTRLCSLRWPNPPAPPTAPRFPREPTPETRSSQQAPPIGGGKGDILLFRTQVRTGQSCCDATQHLTQQSVTSHKVECPLFLPNLFFPLFFRVLETAAPATRPAASPAVFRRRTGPASFDGR